MPEVAVMRLKLGCWAWSWGVVPEVRLMRLRSPLGWYTRSQLWWYAWCHSGWCAWSQSLTESPTSARVSSNSVTNLIVRIDPSTFVLRPNLSEIRTRNPEGRNQTITKHILPSKCVSFSISMYFFHVCVNFLLCSGPDKIAAPPSWRYVTAGLLAFFPCGSAAFATSCGKKMKENESESFWLIDMIVA